MQIEPTFYNPTMASSVPTNYLMQRQNEMANLTKHLNQVIVSHPDAGWHYKEFGKQVEQPVIQYLIQKGLLVKGKLIDRSANKNEIPDIVDIQYSKPIFIDIKAGNVVQFASGGKVTNANQDLSTTFRWRDEVLKKFDGELCFFIEVKYHHVEGQDLYVTECVFDHFYKFVGKTTDGLIAHRRRNVRTKAWNKPAQFKSAQEFQLLLERTIASSVKNTLYGAMADLTTQDKIELRDYLINLRLD